MQIDHPEIEEFIEMRRPTGGDVNRRSLNLHHGVLVSDDFMRAVETDSQWALRSPNDGSVQSTISARNLWIRLLTARVETGDVNRRSLNLHHGVLVSDDFMRAVETDSQWALRSPNDGSVQSTISARNLWIRLLTARVETGEPYVVYIDTVNRQIPQHHKLAGLKVKTSNLCSEITLPT